MRTHLALAWILLAAAPIGTVLVDAVAGGMIVVARCVDRVLDHSRRVTPGARLET